MSPQLRGAEVLRQDIREQDPSALLPPVGPYTVAMYYAADKAGYDGKLVADSIPVIQGGYEGLEQLAREVDQAGGDLVRALESAVKIPDQNPSGGLRRAEEGITDMQFALSLRQSQTFLPDSDRENARLRYGARLTCDGRYATEVYPLDSLPVVLGLLSTGEVGPATDIIDNETREIHTYGYPFNGYHLRGRRSPDGKPWPYNYYAGRTQFPTYFEKVRALAEHLGDDEVYLQYQPAMLRLWQFYNEGSNQLDGPADGRFHTNRRLVKTPEGLPENRHWDNTNDGRPFNLYIPRLEAVGDDVDSAAEAAARVPARYRDRVRAAHYVDRMAAGESGEDFSADRWAGGSRDLSELRTTKVLPVDLQCALIDAAQILEHSYNVARAAAEKRGDPEGAARAYKAAVYFFNERLARSEAVQKYHYDPTSRTFRDVEMLGIPLAEAYRNWRQTDSVSLAAMYALHAGVSDIDQSVGVVDITGDKLLRTGGLMVTSRETGQQWDRPNRWAGKSIMAIRATIRAAARFPGTPAAEKLLEFAKEARRNELHGNRVRFAISRMFEEKINAENPYTRAVSGSEYNNKPEGEDHVNFSMSAEGFIALKTLDVDAEYERLVEDYQRGAGSMALAGSHVTL